MDDCIRAVQKPLSSIVPGEKTVIERHSGTERRSSTPKAGGRIEGVLRLPR